VDDIRRELRGISLGTVSYLIFCFICSVEWNRGYVLMTIFIFIFCICMRCVSVVDLMKMERFSEKAKFIISILYGAVNVGTNLAAAFGLSETIYAFLCLGCGVVHFGLCVYLVTDLVGVL
jgi:predicted MFS family arabinose efflux permease